MPSLCAVITVPSCTWAAYNCNSQMPRQHNQVCRLRGCQASVILCYHRTRDGSDAEEFSDDSAELDDAAAVAAAEADANSTDVEDLSGEYDDSDELMCVPLSQQNYRASH